MLRPAPFWPGAGMQKLVFAFVPQVYGCPVAGLISTGLKSTGPGKDEPARYCSLACVNTGTPALPSWLPFEVKAPLRTAKGSPLWAVKIAFAVHPPTTWFTTPDEEFR